MHQKLPGSAQYLLEPEAKEESVIEATRSSVKSRGFGRPGEAMTLRYFSGFYGVKMCPVFQPDMTSMQSRGLDTVVVPATMSV